MKNKEWLKNIMKLDLAVEGNSFTFMIDRFKELGMLQVDLEEKSVTIVEEDVELYPEDYEDLIIMLNDYLMEDECEIEECCGLDLKYEFKDEYNYLVNQLNDIQESVEQITRQESDLKVGFLSGQLYKNIGNLKMKFWELENKLNNL